MFYHQETTWEYLSTRIQALKLKKLTNITAAKTYATQLDCHDLKLQIS